MGIERSVIAIFFPYDENVRFLANAGNLETDYAVLFTRGIA